MAKEEKKEEKVDEAKEEAKSTKGGEVTDILEEYYKEDGEEKCKKTYMSGKKKIKEEIVNA